MVTRSKEVASHASGAADAQRLQRSVLSLPDIVFSTMANMAPAFSVYFGFAAIVAVVGAPISVPLVVGGIGIAFLGNTIAEFTKSLPSTGAFVTFTGKTFGPATGLATAMAVNLGYIISAAGVLAISADFVSGAVDKYLGFHPAWQLTAAFIVVVTLTLNLRGVKLSTHFARACLVFEFAVLSVVSILAIVDNASSLSLAPLSPGHLSGGLHGFGIAFALSILLFLGWENSASMAEESHAPRRDVPRAIFASIAMIVLLYIVASYATVTSFHGDTKALTSDPIPFLTEAKSVAGFLVPFAYLAAITSIFGIFTAGTNAQARVLFNSGRERLLPSVLGRVSESWRTPWVALVVYFGLELGGAYAFGWSTAPGVFFAEAATLGVIFIVVVYMLTNLALPFYYRREHPDAFHVGRHLVAPLLGIAALAYPLWTLVKPGQVAPYSQYRWIVLGVCVVSFAVAAFVSRRVPDLERRVGSIIADEG
jgi:amino acid transporter